MSERPPEVDAAFAELGLSVDTRAEELRRAYLRVVKVRKPETDPEGFRKAREAFDLLTGWFQFLASRAAQAASPTSEPEPAGVEAPPSPPPAEQPLHPWDSLRPLLEARDAAGARARIRELLAADVTPPALMPVFFLLLDLQRSEPGADGRATLRAFVTWVERARVELAFAQHHELWLMVKEVANLPDETPPEIERAIVEGVLAGSLEPTFKNIEAYTREHPEISDGLILPLSSKSPLLHQLLTPVLNIELIKQRDAGEFSPHPTALVDEPPSPRRGWLDGMPVGMLVFALLGLAKFCAREVNEPSKYLAMPEERSSFSKLERSITALPEADPRFAPGPLTPSTGSPLDELCRRAPADCATAKAARRMLATGDCVGARAEYRALVLSPALAPGSPAADALRKTIQSLEPGVALCQLP